MKQAVIIGPYLLHNFGDDLIGALLAKHLISLGYKVRIPGISNNNCEWLGILKDSDKKTAIRSSDLLVIGGGGILGDSGVKPNNRYRWLCLKAALYAKLLGKRIVITGIGAGPLFMFSSKILTFFLVLMSKTTGVRDEESSMFLRSLGVKKSKIVEGADIALLADDYLKITHSSSGKTGIQFNVSQYKDHRQNPELDLITDRINSYISENHDNLIIISNSKQAPELTYQRASTLCYEELSPFLNELSGLKAIVTTHLHLAITAYSLRIPCFSLYVRKKTERFYKQIGHPQRAIDLRKASVADFDNIIKEANAAKWTEQDEMNLRNLKMKSKKLLDLLNDY